MKGRYSLLASFIILLFMVQSRLTYPGTLTENGVKVTTWDAFGYYMYLPGMFIYQDVTKLDWLHEIDKQYSVTGGDGWQAQKADNGNYVFKYLGGVAIMEMPLFFAGHLWAKATGQPTDGFSPPYQLSLAFGIILYCFLAILLLRRVLLHYFTDGSVAIALLLVCLATNFIQYAAVDNAQSHAYIFVLYVIVLWATIKWHEQPKAIWAALTGYTIGLATMSRPTEAIMLFIPLLWNTHTKEEARRKWALVKEHKAHVWLAVVFGLIGVLPQLIYWKIVTGSFIYDVGSKWVFFNPHFRVLLGWEKGWFIYTPITVFFIAGMWLVKKFPFKNSVIWFCILNIWIIIAWGDWRYGGSYSTRALVQSYPVFALPLAAFVQKLSGWKWKVPVYILFAYLLVVNIFQVYQYNKGIIHYNDMNRKYYSKVYLNAYPSTEEFSLLDHDEFLENENRYQRKVTNYDTARGLIQIKAGERGNILSNIPLATPTPSWIKVELSLKGHPLWGNYLNGEIKTGDSVKNISIRLLTPIRREDDFTSGCAFYAKIPTKFSNAELSLYIKPSAPFITHIYKVRVTQFWK